ncbi:MAG: DUF2802 domain-containing protein [Rhodocyclales bacterium]|nr:DUF2802 domain-containing protein [Rhodocyclales bacterium]
MTDFFLLGIRALIWMAVVLAGGYFIYSLLRLVRIRRKRRSVAVPLPSAPPATEVPAAESGFLRNEPQLASYAVAPVESSPPPPDEALQAPAPDFSRELARSSLEIEVQSLRREMHRLRTDMTQLTAEVQQLKTARSVSPLYSEAMTMAQQGVTAASISDRCGISLGEAELVAALARGGSDSAFHDEKGEHDDRYPDAGH